MAAADSDVSFSGESELRLPGQCAESAGPGPGQRHAGPGPAGDSAAPQMTPSRIRNGLEKRRLGWSRSFRFVTTSQR